MQVVTPVRRSARKQPPQPAVAALLLETDFAYAPNPVHAPHAAHSPVSGDAPEEEEEEEDVVHNVDAEDDSDAVEDHVNDFDVLEVRAAIYHLELTALDSSKQGLYAFVRCCLTGRG